LAYKVGTVLLEIKSDTAKLVSGMDRAEKSIYKLKRSFADLVKAAAAIYGITKTFQMLNSMIIETSAKFEKFSLILETLEGNSKKAQADLEWIKKFAQTTPYEIDKVTEAFVKLKSYGLDAQKELRVLGDTAAAMGKPLDMVVEAIADAVTGEFERLKEFGVKAYQQGNKVAFTWADASGKARYIVVNNNREVIESTLTAIWNSKYAGSMKKLSNSWDGIISNMKDAWTNFKADTAKLSFAEAKKDLLVLKSVWTDTLNDMKGPVADFETSVVKGFKQIVLGAAILDDSISDIVGVVTHTFKGVVYGIEYMLYGIPAAVEDAINGVLALLNKLPDWIKNKIGVKDFRVNMGWSVKRDKYADASIKEFAKVKEIFTDNIVAGKTGETYAYWKKKFEEAEKEVIAQSNKTLKKQKQIGQQGQFNRSEFKQNNISTKSYLDYAQRKALTQQAKLENKLADYAYKQKLALLKQINNEYNKTVKTRQQLLDDWYKKTVQAINIYLKGEEKASALAKVQLIYKKKEAEIQKQDLQNAQKLIAKYKGEYISEFGTQQEQLSAWYKEQYEYIQKTIKDEKERVKVLKELNTLMAAKMNKLQDENKPVTAIMQQAKELMKLLDAYKNAETEEEKNTYKTILTETFEGRLLFIADKAGEKFGFKVNKNIVAGFLLAEKYIKEAAGIFKGIAEAFFNSMYDSIKDRYTGLIDSLQQKVYTKELQSTAYNAFGQSGYGAVASYEGSITNVQMLKTQMSMYYELSKRAKEWKESIQDTIEIAGTTWAALGAASGMGINSVSQMIDGINFAMQGQKWAEEITGFKNFQQNYIDAVDKFKQAVRDLAKSLIDIAGRVYNSIKDYRSLYDKITGTNTYKLQEEAEALQEVSKYTQDLSVDSIASFTQDILQAQKDFTENAVVSTKDLESLTSATDLFSKYGLAIDSLNEKFKDSLSIVADLIAQQREANDAINDYIAELKGIAGDTNYNLEYTQQQYAIAKQEYLEGKIDSNTLLEKAKAFQEAAGNNSDLINLLANSLEGVTQQSTEDYLKGILESTQNLATVGLPDTNIEDLTAPQENTLDAIKDTNSYLEKLLDLFKGGFTDMFGDVINILKDILSAIGNVIGAIFNVAGNIIGSVISIGEKLFNGLFSAAGNIIGSVISIGEKLFNGLFSAAGNIIGNIANEIGKILGGITSAVGSITGAIGNVISSIADWSKKILDGIVAAAGSIIKGTLSFAVNSAGMIVDLAGTVITDVSKWASDLMGGVGDAIGSVGDALGNVFGGIGDALGGLFAEGGFTGTGTYTDSTGERVAGIVHEGEWVAPKWMVNSFPSLFASLEKARITKSDISIPALSIANNNVNVSVNLTEIQITNSILKEQLSLHRKMYRLLLKFDEEGIKCVS
jgi:hypothetical protein